MLNDNFSFDFDGPADPLIIAAPMDSKSRLIHDLALARAKKYIVAEADLLQSIMEVDHDRVFESFGFTHLTPYCVKLLGLSEEVAANFVRVARKSKEVPELKLAIDQGQLTVTKAKSIAAVVTKDSCTEWIQKAADLPKAKIEREFANIAGAASRPERAKPIKNNKVRIELELTRDEMDLFRRAQELVCQKLRRPATLAETQVALLTAFLDRHDPVKKADRSRERSLKSAAQSRTLPKVSVESTLPFDHRATIPAKVKHEVFKRDQGRCQAHLPDGTKCESRKWIDLHHLRPVSAGGADTLDNLITLCSGHHRIHHRSTECPRGQISLAQSRRNKKTRGG